MIEIILNTDTSNFQKLLISVDNKPVNFRVEQNKILILDSTDLGMHVLRVQLCEPDSKLDITDVTVNGASLRQTLFFSYIEQGTTRIQPATCIWDPTQTWVLPFMNPVSHWIGLLGEKLRKDALGTDLSQDYRIYIPESCDFDDRLPAAITDFFKFDFDCVILHKDEISQRNLPYEIYSQSINTDGVYDEIYKNIDFIRSKLPLAQGQNFYNQKDDKNFDYTDCWFTVTICRVRDGDKKYHVAGPDLLPKTYAMIDSLNLDYDAMTISVSPPGKYAYPHIDKRVESGSEKFIGCKQLYIPLNYPAGAAIKFRNVGVLPEVPIIINTQYYSHAVVNDSNQTRIVVSVIYDYQLK